MSSDGLPPVSVQNITIDTDLNASLFDILLLGVYTTVYAGTTYIYVSRKKSHNIFVLGAITWLYLLNIGQAAVDWFLVKSLVDLAGAPKETFYIFASFSPSWSILSTDIFQFLLSTIADGLLIWRCYNVWDRSLRMISISLLLLFFEAGLYMSAIFTVGATKLDPSSAMATVLNDLFAAALFTSTACTLLTTLLIVWRVHSVSRQSGLSKQSARSFGNILDLLVQSAAVYAIASLTLAMVTVIPLDVMNPSGALSLSIAQYYMDTIFPVTAGMAPTIMVARVALSSANTVYPPTAHISELDFRGAETTGTSQISAGDSHTVSKA